MSFEAWLTLLVVAAAVVALATERLSAPFAILGSVTVLLVAGVIDPGQAFSGFSNPAPITVAALYVLAGAAESTGALDSITTFALGKGRSSERTVLARVLSGVAAASSVLNNTPIVAMVAPRVDAWARRTGRAPSRLLMPVSFAAVVGGLITVIGTSTNVVVVGLMQNEGLRPLSMFEIGKVGLPIAIVCLVVMVLTAPWLLPDRRRHTDGGGPDPREYTIEMVVQPAGPMAGRTVADAGLRNLEGVYLIEIERSGHMLAPVPPDEVLVAGDRLTFAGNVARIVDLQRMLGLAPAEERHFSVTGPGPGRRFFEVVVAPGGRLAGTTLKESGFRGAYGAAVVAIHRAGERMPGKLGEVSLHAGDVLLVVSDGSFRNRWKDHRDFLLVSPLDGALPVRRQRAWIVRLVMLGVVAVAGSGLVDILDAALVGAVLLVAFGVMNASEARDSVDLNVLVVLAGSFGLGAAMETTGLAETIGRGLVSAFGGLGDIGILLGVLIATIVLTELITNNAAAVLMFPIAMQTAAQAGLDARGLAVAVAVGASAGFLTPIGYQTNMMVYGMGGYRFTDFARYGFPLTICTIVVSLLVIPGVWPLR